MHVIEVPVEWANIFDALVGEKCVLKSTMYQMERSMKQDQDQIEALKKENRLLQQEVEALKKELASRPPKSILTTNPKRTVPPRFRNLEI